MSLKRSCHWWKTSQPNNGRLRRKTDNCWGRDTEEKVVDEKPPDPGGVLGGKPTPYDWGLKGRGSRARHETWESKGRSFDEGRLQVTCSHVQSRQVCWAQELSRNHFRIDYRQGKANRAADALSHFSSEEPEQGGRSLSPFCTKFLSAKRTSSLRYFSSGDKSWKKMSKPRN